MSADARREGRARAGERGGALITAIFATVVSIGLIAAFFSVIDVQARQVGAARETVAALFIAEAGFNEALHELQRQADVDGDGLVGSVSGAFGGGWYVVTRSISGAAYTITSTATYNGVTRRVEAVAEPSVASAFRRAVSALQNVSVTGDGFVDSYDSAVGDYGGSNVGFDGDILAATAVDVRDTADVHGDAQTGPSGTVTIAGNGVVSGTTSPAADGPSVPVVAAPSAGTSAGPISLTGTGTTRTIPPGTWRFDSVFVTNFAQLTIRGPARIVVDGDFRATFFGQVSIDASRGPVEVFVGGTYEGSVTSRVSSTPRRPSNFTIIMTGTGTALHRSANPTYGCFFSREGEIRLNENARVFGAVVGRRVRIQDNARLHFDVDLARRSEYLVSLYRVRCWRELDGSR